ncbi:MAG: redoxin domain-containing protein [Planctomycetes bacterium]|nr:redoxin domain-containing protein [Planctomycetota bacterium]
MTRMIRFHDRLKLRASGPAAIAAATVVASAMAVPPMAAEVAPTADRAAAAAADFLLESTTHERVSLWAPRPERRGTVVAFLRQDCPVSKLFAPVIGALAKEYSEQGFTFLAVDATPGVDATKAAAFARSTGLDLDPLLDPLGAVAPRFEIANAGSVVVLDESLVPVYRGAIDDRPTSGAPGRPQHDWLVEAIEALIADEEVAVEGAPATGRELASSTKPKITYHEHVAPILHTQCAVCHHEGQVGPMELLDYDDAKGWAPQIAEVVGNGRMPPWHADPRFGSFENERRLTETEKATLIEWAAAGAPAGDAKKKQPATKWDDDGWAMGTPDLVIQLPEPESIPATGYVDYRYKLVDPKLTKDVWVQAAEIRPTARDATHHVLALYIPPGKAPLEALTGLNDGSLVGAGYFAVQVPGCRPNIYPAGAGKKIEAGAKFLFQLHYTPNGKATTDQCQMGLQFCKEPPKQEVKTRGVFSYRLRIPPNEPRYVTTAEWAFKKPTRLISMFPHMHTRGTAFRFEKVVGKGASTERTILCDVPKYDFNWQNFYLPKEPPLFAAGDTIFCTAAYDNSTGNPFNPDPSKTVQWGDQTYEEMMIGYIDYIEEE